MVKNTTICFNSNSFLGSTVLIAVSLIVAAVYFTLEFSKERSKLERCLNRPAPPVLPAPKAEVVVIDRNSRGLDKSYPSGSYVPRENNFSNFENIGYIFNDDGRFPLYMNRLSNRYYYYTRDDSRNNIKITIGDADHGLKDEYYDGDTISVPELSATPFTAKIYENKTNIYNPFGINTY